MSVAKNWEETNKENLVYKDKYFELKNRYEVCKSLVVYQIKLLTKCEKIEEAEFILEQYIENNVFKKKDL